MPIVIFMIYFVAGKILIKIVFACFSRRQILMSLYILYVIFQFILQKMSINKFDLEKVAEFKKRILPASSVLIVTHDFPDPDCIAAAFGLQQLLFHWGISTCQITFGGFVGRAENRAMIRFLNIQAVPLMLIERTDFERVVMVDSYPGEGNVSLPSNFTVDAVIDHHPHFTGENASFFSDIRKEIGATSTLITKYLKIEQCLIDSPVATALFYGIKTDTNDLSRHVSKDDLDCYKELFNRIDHQELSRIEYPDRDAEYFRILHRSAESMTVYKNTIGHSHIGQISTPDYIAEIADLFHSLEDLEWMICSALFKNHIFFSIRSKTEETAGINAEKIAEKLQGNGGGHATKSAGQIPIQNGSVDETVEEFIKTFKSVFDIRDDAGHSILN